MGSCATKNADNEVTIPQNPRLQQFYKQYCQIINITHPLNVNIKYNNFFKILPEEFTGTGIKKTNCYESKLSYEEWQKKREEFWESRIEGSAQNWAAIRQAVEADEQNAKAILNAVELRLVNQSIQILYDPQGQKYDVPIFCINKPVQFPNKKSFEQNLYMSFEKKQINFKGRCSKWQKDMDFTFNTQDKVQLIRDKISKEQKVRLFFSGREMHAHHQIGNYGVIEGAVIQIIMTKNPTEIKSLRSSCLLTEGVCSPTERKPQKQAIQGQQFQNEVFDNIYLKQSYLPDKKKLHTQQYNTTIKSYKSPPKIKSQSLSNIKLECRLDCKLDSKVDSKLDSKIEVKKHKPLMKKIKQKITSTARANKSPAKSKSKPNKPLNDIIKKFIKSKIPKSKSKSPEPKRLKNKKVINSSPKFQILPQSPTYLSPKYDDPSDRKQRTLSKKRPRFGSPQKLQQTLQTQRIQQLIQKPKSTKKQQKKRNDIKVDSQEHQSKHSSFRLNTISMQKSFLSEDPQKQLLEEIQQLDQFQLSQFQKFLQNLKNGKKDEAQQTSLHEPERSSLRENIQQSHQKLAMEPKPVPVEKIKRDNSLIWEEICLQRETGIKLRVNTQLQAFESLLQQQKISPRSFHQKKQIIQNWSQKQLDQLNSLKSNLQQIQTLSNSLLKRNQADLLFVNDLQNNSSLALNPLNESQSVDISVLKEESFIDQSDIQFSLPNSPKIPANSPISNLNMKKKDIVIEQAEPAVYHRQLQVSPTENQGKISEFEKIPDLNMITQARFTNLKFESVTMLTIQHLIDEAAEEIFQFCNISPQPQMEQFNYPQGIQTNLGIINEVINKLCQFITEQKHDQFIGRMNYPYGKMPFQRLRSLHGYEDENEIPNNPLENYFQQFVEYLNLEDAPFQEFEITHNKAIFDAFNETLNIFRPFFMVNGLPYPWCYSERHLTVIIINNDNLQILFEKVKQKVLEYASSLCGLLSDEDHVNVKGNYQSALDQIQQQENDYVGFIREERLQKVLLQEITENEYQWHQSDDQKTEILMEVTDYLFEELIEEMLHELV